MLSSGVFPYDSSASYLLASESPRSLGVRKQYHFFYFILFGILVAPGFVNQMISLSPTGSQKHSKNFDKVSMSISQSL